MNASAQALPQTLSEAVERDLREHPKKREKLHEIGITEKFINQLTNNSYSDTYLMRFFDILQTVVEFNLKDAALREVKADLLQTEWQEDPLSEITTMQALIEKLQYIVKEYGLPYVNERLVPYSDRRPLRQWLEGKYMGRKRLKDIVRLTVAYKTKTIESFGFVKRAKVLEPQVVTKKEPRQSSNQRVVAHDVVSKPEPVVPVDDPKTMQATRNLIAVLRGVIHQYKLTGPKPEAIIDGDIMHILGLIKELCATIGLTSERLQRLQISDDLTLHDIGFLFNLTNLFEQRS